MAHMLEERGLPTTVIALVRPQVEKNPAPACVDGTVHVGTASG